MPEKRMIRVKRKHIPDTRTKRTQRVHEKQKRAAELRQAGVKYDDIAHELGYSNPSGAKKAVDAFLARQEMELARDVVMMDLRRLDEMQMLASHALRQKGDLNQIDRLMRIMEMRYRLVGVSPRTLMELQDQYGITNKTEGITNNGVMVIQGSSGDFVKSMMIAAGADPEDPEVKEKMKQIERNQKRRAPVQVVPGEVLDEDQVQALSEEEVVDAEIVDD